MRAVCEIVKKQNEYLPSARPSEDTKGGILEKTRGKSQIFICKQANILYFGYHCQEIFVNRIIFGKKIPSC